MFFFYVGTYSLIWGIANFSMRYYSFKEAMPTGVFLTAWYGGAFLAALTLLFSYQEKGGAANTQRLSARGVIGSAILALCIAVSLALGYWAFKFAPQTAIQPLYLVAEMTVPALIGLFIFKERKGLTRQEWIFFAMGFAGGTMIALTA